MSWKSPNAIPNRNSQPWGTYAGCLLKSFIWAAIFVTLRFCHYNWWPPNCLQIWVNDASKLGPGWWCSGGQWMGSNLWKGNFGKGFALQDAFSLGWGLNPVDIQMSHSNWGGFGWFWYGSPENIWSKHRLPQFCYDWMSIGNGIHHQSIAMFKGNYVFQQFSHTYSTLDMIVDIVF